MNKMKFKMKTLFYCCALVALFISCSPDSASPVIQNSVQTPPTGIVPIKIIYPSAFETDTTSFSYNGNKLDKIKYGNTISKYFYNNDFITKIDLSDLGGTVYSSITYDYDSSGRLSQVKRTNVDIDQSMAVKSTFQYNSNGTMTVTDYTGDNFTQETISATHIYFIGTNNEIASIQTTPVGGSTETTTYSYDTKNNPLKNVTGMNSLRLTNLGNKFNVQSITYTGFPNESYVYTYTSDSYPHTVTHIIDGVENSQAEYFYNQ